MTEAFGGPLYQMLNPGAQQLVDKLGLRGQGLSGFAAEAISPARKIKILKKQYDRLLKAEKLEFDPGSSKDILEAEAIRKSIPYNSSQEIADEILKLEGKKPLDPKLFEKLRKEFDI
tara:strand:- start:84 stop:434 length:351 start_codon:yes stop_codon:yes gene_type:complete